MAVNNTSEKFTLLIGVGQFEHELISYLKEKRKLKIMDIRNDYVEKMQKMYPDLEFITGDSSSLVTWNKLNKNSIGPVIITVNDKEVVRETCKIIREVLELEVLIIAISFESFYTPIIEEYNVTVIKPLELGMGVVDSMLDKNVSWPVNIGNRKGEIVEVHVLKNSHLIGIRMKHIRPVNWNIALIYRDGKQQLPTPNTRISIGDRVILVGEPSVVKGVSEILSKGEPNFPLQFGQNIAVFASSQYPMLVDEGVLFLKKTLAKKLNILPVAGRMISGLAEKLKKEEIEFEVANKITGFEDTFDIKEGVLVLPKHRGLFKSAYYRRLYRNSKSPLLITGGVKEYDRLVISLNTETPSLALETGVELAKLLNIPYSVVYVNAVKNIRTQQDKEYLDFRKNIIADFEMSEGATIDFHILEGNPVHETLKFLQSFNEIKVFYVMTYDPDQKISFFDPNVQYHIMKKADVSILGIPVEDTYA